MKNLYYKFLQRIAEYDRRVWYGIKTHLSLILLVAAFLLLPEGKLQAFVTVLGMGHIFVLREAKRHVEQNTPVSG